MEDYKRIWGKVLLEICDFQENRKLKTLQCFTIDATIWNVKYDLRKGDRIYHENSLYWTFDDVFLFVVTGCAHEQAQTLQIKIKQRKTKNFTTTFYPICMTLQKYWWEMKQTTISPRDWGREWEPLDYEPFIKEIAKNRWSGCACLWQWIYGDLVILLKTLSDSKVNQLVQQKIIITTRWRGRRTWSFRRRP